MSQSQQRVPEAFRTRQWSRLNDEGAVAAFANRVAKLIVGSAVAGKRDSSASPLLAKARPFLVSPSNDIRASPSVSSTSLPFDGLRANGEKLNSPATTTLPSIAVLAFANRSASADDEYFSDGLADELLNVLAKINGLRVVARTSSFSFKGKSDDVATIGAKLNVAILLEGSVRKSGNRVRIAVQLVQVADSAHLWSETYDRTLDDIFAVQDDIAQAVVTKLRAALLGNVGSVSSDATTDISSAISHVPAHQTMATAPAVATLGRTSNSEAHRLRMQGRSLFQRSDFDDRRAAIPLFEHAVTIDPNYAGAWADLSFALYWRSASGGDGKTPGVHNYWEGYKAAQMAADHAIALEPNLPEALLARAAMTRIVDLNQYDALQQQFDECEAMLPQLSILLHRDLPGAMLGWAKGDIVASYAMLDRIKNAAAVLACYQIAEVHAYRLEADATFIWLEKCIEVRDTGVFNVKTDRLFNFVHNDPRWMPMLNKLGFADEADEANKED